MDPTVPVTKEEALRYDKDAVLAEIERRNKNIDLFKGEIAKEEKEIQRLYQIVAIIDASK